MDTYGIVSAIGLAGLGLLAYRAFVESDAAQARRARAVAAAAPAPPPVRRRRRRRRR